MGHSHDFNHRGVGGGILGSAPPHLVMGMNELHPNPRFFEFVGELGNAISREGHLPKMEFPKFDGEIPRLWKDRCETHFEVFGVSEALKSRFAALNIVGPVANWLQAFELRGRVQSWDAHHKTVCERFHRDQYQLHMKQLDNLK